MTAPTDWWNGFFTGLMADFWQAVIPPDTTLAEVGFFEKALALRPGARVLDAPCGHGRHAVELARRGFRVTGLDRSAELLARARSARPEEGVSRSTCGGDMRDLPGRGVRRRLLRGQFLRLLRRRGQPGISAPRSGRFVREDGSASTRAGSRRRYSRLLREKLEIEIAGIRFEAENRYDPRTGYLESLFTATADGRRESRPGRHRVFTCRRAHRDGSATRVSTRSRPSAPPRASPSPSGRTACSCPRGAVSVNAGAPRERPPGRAEGRRQASAGVRWLSPSAGADRRPAGVAADDEPIGAAGRRGRLPAARPEREAGDHVHDGLAQRPREVGALPGRLEAELRLE